VSKKIKVALIGIPLLIIASIAFYVTDFNEQLKVKSYVKEKYGYNIKIKQLLRAGIGSDYDFVVYPKDHSDLEFNVRLDSSNQITDNHASAIEADKALHKLEKVIPAIEELGFQGAEYQNNEIRVSYVDDMEKHILNLYTSTPLEMATFKENELDRFYKLQELIKQSGASLTYVAVQDMQEPVSNSIVFYMKDVQNVQSKDDFLLQVKKSSQDLASYIENEKWEAERAKVENDRFTFQSQYDDYWFHCRETNEKGECTNILVTTYFKENSLTKSNVYLEQDLDSIFNLFGNTIKPKATIEYHFVENGSDNRLTFTEQEIANYENTLDFINKNFN